MNRQDKLLRQVTNRRRVLAFAGVSTLTLATGCGTMPQLTQIPDAVKKAAADAALIANAFAGIVQPLGSVVGINQDVLNRVSGYVAELQHFAASLATMQSVPAAATTVTKIESLVNGIVAALSVVALPTPIGTVLQAANVLLPVIEGVLGMFVTSKGRAVGAARPPMTPDQARQILAMGVAHVR